MKRPNLKVITHAHTEAILFDPDQPRKVDGVRFKRRGTTTDLKLADGGEVIMSVGDDRIATNP